MPARRNGNKQRGSGKHRGQQTSFSTERKEKLHSFMLRGLQEIQVRQRLREYGPNSFEKKKEETDLSIFVSQFRSPLIYILVIAVLVTLILRDWVDAGVIGLAVVVNTVLGFYQERKAQRAIAALRQLLSPKATVIREGKRRVVDATDVVPGDVCIVGLGERIAADGVVLSAHDFSVSEAILTGESVPVHKRVADLRQVKVDDFEAFTGITRDLSRESRVFAGTIVSSGEATILIAVTGSQTDVGRIASSLSATAEEQTPLQKRITHISNQLAVFVGMIALIIFITGILFGVDVSHSLVERFEVMFTTSVAVAVAAIPEGLAVSLTVILALGMQRILRRKALVRKLVAAETLGGVTVICSDKTGTLTEGVMRVTEADFVDENEGIRAAVLTNDQRDPLEVALWDWVQSEKHLDPQYLIEEQKRIDSIPFSPEEKYTAKLYADRVYVMGAPEVVLSFCAMTGPMKQRWLKKFEAYGFRGLRIVGFAMRTQKRGERKLTKKGVTQGLQWLGIIGYEDPIRSGVASALAEAKRAGIQIKVITGDYRATAEAVLGQLGLLNQKAKLRGKLPLTMDGEELERLTPDELQGRVSETILFTRIDPIQKLKIVEALQANGEVVAMTGDGVNDAPALKRADIGIVVSGATDVSKETADMVLLDDNFSTIIAAVEEGRGIFENLRKVILYLLSDSFSEVILVLGSLALRIPLPITAAQILWINLITDGFPNLALTVEPKDADLMKQRPRDRREPLIDSEIKLLIILISVVTGIATLLVFFLFWNSYANEESSRVIAFVMLGVDSLIYVFSARSLRHPIWQTLPFGNPWLVLAVLGGFAFQLAALYVPFLQNVLHTRPLNGFEWFVVFAEAILVIGVIEIVKWIFFRRRLQEQWDRVLY